MSENAKQWTDEELYELTQRRGDLHLRELEYDEEGWWAAGGPKHDMAVGSHLVQKLILEKVNRILGLTGKSAFTDLSAPVAE